MNDEDMKKIVGLFSDHIISLKNAMNLDQKKYVLSLMLMDSDLINNLTTDEYDEILKGMALLRMLGSLE